VNKKCMIQTMDNKDYKHLGASFLQVPQRKGRNWGVKLPVLPHGASSQLRRNPPKHTQLRSFGASKGTLFAS
jgi:hypothetical protein